MRASCYLGIPLLLLPAFVGESAASPGPEAQKPRNEMGVTRSPPPWTSLSDKDLSPEVVTERASLMQNSG